MPFRVHLLIVNDNEAYRVRCGVWPRIQYIRGWYLGLGAIHERRPQYSYSWDFLPSPYSVFPVLLVCKIGYLLDLPNGEVILVCPLISLDLARADRVIIMHRGMGVSLGKWKWQREGKNSVGMPHIRKIERNPTAVCASYISLMRASISKQVFNNMKIQWSLRELNLYI